jgi:hypothetical protein
MALAAGSRLGPYEILAAIGAGGPLLPLHVREMVGVRALFPSPSP